MTWSLQRALFALIGVALVAGLLPAGLVLDRRVATEIEKKARADLAPAPRVMIDREHMAADAMMMHAKDLAGTRDLMPAFAERHGEQVAALLTAVPLANGEEPLAVGADGSVWIGVHPGEPLLSATQQGGNPAAVVLAGDQLRRVAVAPVMRGDQWLGAVGVSTPLDHATAGILAGLMRSEVVLLAQPNAGAALSVVAATTNETLTGAIADAAALWRDTTAVRELHVHGGGRHLVVFAPLGDVAWAAFVRDLDTELQIVPELRRTAAFAAAFALGVALILGSVLAAFLARPVRSLARAADRLAAGDFDSQLERSSVVEVNRLAHAFEQMRSALSARLQELEAANTELGEKQQRLRALQAELIQRDRLAATGRLVAELAHEIRNPVANVRNCLEVVRRRLGDDPDSLEFVELAIGEILRMHELAERVLDLNRPRDPSIRHCNAAAVAREVVALARVGASAGTAQVEIVAAEEAEAAIAPDALKQVLLNVTQNAREAMTDSGQITISIKRTNGRVVVQVADDGPGIPDDVLPNVFDAFFTTKSAVQGVGLGLFVAEGILSSYGGRISAANRSTASAAANPTADGAARAATRTGGAVFRIDVPAAFVDRNAAAPLDSQARDTDATADERESGT